MNMGAQKERENNHLSKKGRHQVVNIYKGKLKRQRIPWHKEKYQIISQKPTACLWAGNSVLPNACRGYVTFYTMCMFFFFLKKKGDCS